MHAIVVHAIVVHAIVVHTIVVHAIVVHALSHEVVHAWSRAIWYLKAFGKDSRTFNQDSRKFNQLAHLLTVVQSDPYVLPNHPVSA